MALPRNTSSFEILISYIDLSRKVTRGSEVLVNYSYLADGTKVCAINGR